VGDREILEAYLNSTFKNTLETDIFSHETKSLLTGITDGLKYVTDGLKYITDGLKYVTNGLKYVTDGLKCVTNGLMYVTVQTANCVAFLLSSFILNRN
jgi:hypothetical protein